MFIMMDYRAGGFLRPWMMFFTLYQNEKLWRARSSAECVQTPAKIMWNRGETYVIDRNLSVLTSKRKTWLPLSSYFDARKAHTANGYIAPI